MQGDGQKGIGGGEMIYGLVCGIKEQRELIKTHCFGDCGKIIIGAILDDTLGELGICREVTCPHLDKQMDEPIGADNDGEQITLRKLK
jgi:hypothetical protein